MATTKNTKKISTRSFSDPPENISPDMLIPVINGFHGLLTYVNPRTKEEIKWSEFGDVQDIELADLKTIKSICRKYYERNYLLFDDEYSWVIKYLGVEKYYEGSLTSNDFDEIFTKSPSDIRAILASMSGAQKDALTGYSRDKIRSGEIDSFKTIKALEECLGADLIDKE